MRTPELIDRLLRLLSHISGASSASMYLSMEPAESQPTLLAHIGEHPVPELVDDNAAAQLLDAQDAFQEGMELVQLQASEDAACVLIRMSVDSILVRPEAQAREVDERRSNPVVDAAPRIDGTIWFGLRDCRDVQSLVRALQTDNLAPGTVADQLRSTLALCSKMAWSVYQLSGALSDPISQLPGRMELQVFFKRAIAAAKQHGNSISLMLINPDDFSMINHRYGRIHGDLAIREVADALAQCLRQTDGVFRYGGAVFAVVLPATDLQQCRAAAEKIRRHLIAQEYVGNHERLTFSMGGAVASPEDFESGMVEAPVLLHRADLALNRAKLTGGARVVVHSLKDEEEPNLTSSPLSGMFTADTEKDYRNMLLLWETVALISSHPDPSDMAAAMIDRLAIGFQPDRLALFRLDGDDALEPMASNVREDASPEGRASGRRINLDARHRALVHEALASQKAERLRPGHAADGDNATADDSENFTAYAVPLIARDEAIACMYLDGRGRRLQLDSSDVIFLNALASQMAVALDRAQLAAGWIREKDRESRQLREELDELKQTFNDKEMIYRSEEMEALMDTLKRVAPSNATVLITGESGTGKEHLAQAIHTHSNRAEASYVVVDCGAVAHSLLEAELFGHVKGAFTGAESASEGRIAQADGGTLFLDEIGELPLQVQAKLLRFVQEKEFSPVGSGTSRKVDVRIVAATNRRLQDEVATGNFRADLYYRLQVISLQAIPLRHRVADVLPLAEHFIGQFCVQNGLQQKALSSAAEEKLRDHSWPGNVRELQHTMVRAALTAQGVAIAEEDIVLLPETSEHNRGEEIDGASDVRPSMHSAAPAVPPPVVEHDPPAASTDPWQPLRDELLEQIDAALTQNKSRPVPLGRWLTEDLVIAAAKASDNVSRRAARLVGVPESTFRRHFEKATAELQAGLNNRTENWGRVQPLIDKLVSMAREQAGDEQADMDLLDEARLVLLDDVQTRLPEKISVGAALMGVTSPTYKRWLRARDEA